MKESPNIDDLQIRKDFLPWSEKYRPKSLNNFSSISDIRETLNKFIEKKSLPHMLFYGSPGTGKTSAILAVANEIYDASKSLGMVLELNASDDRGINVVREKILSFASSRGLFASTHKLIILDEADSMTKDAQNSLRRIIEKYTENVRFCIICNYQSKIIPAIQSRCMKFRFAPLKQEEMTNRLEFILKSENVTYNEGGILAAINIGAGDMRKTINIIESSYYSFKEVNSAGVYRCCGMPTESDTKTILDILLTQDTSDSFKNFISYKNNQNLSLNDILNQIESQIHKHNFEAIRAATLAKHLADIQYFIDQGSSEYVQCVNLISAFQEFRIK